MVHLCKFTETVYLWNMVIFHTAMLNHQRVPDYWESLLGSPGRIINDVSNKTSPCKVCANICYHQPYIPFKADMLYTNIQIIYIHICIYIYTYIYTHIYIYVYIYIYGMEHQGPAGSHRAFCFTEGLCKKSFPAAWPPKKTSLRFSRGCPWDVPWNTNKSRRWMNLMYACIYIHIYIIYILYIYILYIHIIYKYISVCVIVPYMNTVIYITWLFEQTGTIVAH